MEPEFKQGLVEKLEEFYYTRITPDQARLLLECLEKHRGDYGKMKTAYFQLHSAAAQKRQTKKRKQEVREYNSVLGSISRLQILDEQLRAIALSLNGKPVALATLGEKYEANRKRAEQTLKERHPGKELYALDNRHVVYIAQLSVHARELLERLDTNFSGSWEELQQKHGSHCSEVTEMRMYELIHDTSLFTYLVEYIRQQKAQQETEKSALEKLREKLKELPQHHLIEVLRQIYLNDLTKGGSASDTAIIEFCHKACNGDYANLKSTYSHTADLPDSHNEAVTMLDRIEKLSELERVLKKLHISIDGQRVDLSLIVRRFEPEYKALRDKPLDERMLHYASQVSKRRI